MDFKSYREESKKLGISTGDYYKLQTGENKLRVLTKPEPTISHYIGAGKKPAPCTGTGCNLCLSGAKQTFKIALYILDRSDETIKFAELPWSIFKSLGELAVSSEYGFDNLPPYDLIVAKTGEGMETRYTVTPGRNESPLTPAQQKELANKKPVKEKLLGKVSATSHLESTEDIEISDPDNNLPF